MRAQNIKIKQFELLDLLEYRGIQEINEHGTVSISGHIREEKEQEYLKMFFNDLWVDIVAIEEEEEKILFSGKNIISGSENKQLFDGQRETYSQLPKGKSYL